MKKSKQFSSGLFFQTILLFSLAFIVFKVDSCFIKPINSNNNNNTTTIRTIVTANSTSTSQNSSIKLTFNTCENVLTGKWKGCNSKSPGSFSLDLFF